MRLQAPPVSIGFMAGYLTQIIWIAVWLKAAKADGMRFKFGETIDAKNTARGEELISLEPGLRKYLMVLEELFDVSWAANPDFPLKPMWNHQFLASDIRPATPGPEIPLDLENDDRKDFGTATDSKTDQVSSGDPESTAARLEMSHEQEKVEQKDFDIGMNSSSEQFLTGDSEPAPPRPETPLEQEDDNENKSIIGMGSISGQVSTGAPGLTISRPEVPASDDHIHDQNLIKNLYRGSGSDTEQNRNHIARMIEKLVNLDPALKKEKLYKLL